MMMRPVGHAVELLSDVKGFELAESYPVICCACGGSWSMRPGFAMQGGINSGHWTCKACKAFHHVHIDTFDNVAVSKPWDVYLRESALPSPSTACLECGESFEPSDAEAVAGFCSPECRERKAQREDALSGESGGPS